MLVLPRRNICRRECRNIAECLKRGKRGMVIGVCPRELFTQYGVENCYIELIELFPCDTKDELTTRENHYIRSLVCVNKQLAITTPERRKKLIRGYYKK
jgi:hypothetical protein